MIVHFDIVPPIANTEPGQHHAAAASKNDAVVSEASQALRAALTGNSEETTFLLKAAAGAGKSFALRRLIRDVATSYGALPVAVTAFTNNQVESLLRALTTELGKERVGWLVGKKKAESLDPAMFDKYTIHTRATDFDDDVAVVLATASRFGAQGELNRLRGAFADEADAEPFRVLFVDEAWQLAQHLFNPLNKLAPLVVGVGDVGQLPPLEVGKNPWRGDEKYNPYRAWPHTRDGEPSTWSRELPTVWRPTAAQLDLWRAFYPEWQELTSVAAPGDRTLQLDAGATDLEVLVGWLSRGIPVLLEVDGLDAPEAPDVDLPLGRFTAHLVESLVKADVTLVSQRYDSAGTPVGEKDSQSLRDAGDTVIAWLATRNQSVDDAVAAAEHIAQKYELPENAVRASTVDSWQGQTNGITVAIHPLSGATSLDEFNSAFGRLAVTCTRATHALLVVSRPGLDDLLRTVPALPGTPFGEPGGRQLPRQTHQRILRTFARARVDLAAGETKEI